MRIERQIAKQLRCLAKQYPIVTITGPRQSGKTTLARQVFADYAYINLEEPDIRAIAVDDPRAILQKYPQHLIIDEIQHAPNLLSYLQAHVDQQQQDGMYILTGSHQVALQQALVQSLAGRTALLQLLPLSLTELQQSNISLSSNQILLNGFYPRLHAKQLEPARMYSDYVKTYLERDVRQMINIKDLLVFQRFLKLCAALCGQMLNINNLSNDVGVSHHTIKHWLSILEASFVIKLLPPYFENFGKRMVRSPKLYFSDVGLACYLLEIETISQIDRDPLRGHLFENMVVMELIKTRFNQGRDANLYYYRDQRKNEVDLIYKQGTDLIPIEIKSAQTIDNRFWKNISFFRKLVGNRCANAYLIYAGEQEFSLSEGHVLNYQHCAQLMQE